MPASGAIRAGRAFVEMSADNDPLFAAFGRAQRRMIRWAEQARRSLSVGVRLVRQSAFYRSLDDAQARFQRARDRMQSAGLVTLRFAVAGTAALGLGVFQLTNAASEAEEVGNRFNQVLQGQALAGEAFVEDMARRVGRSATKLKDKLPSLFALFQGAAIAPGDSRVLSEELLGLSVDFASFQNISDEDALGKFIAALGGSGEVLQTYGIDLKQAAINQKALNTGLDPASLTEQQKLLLRVAIIRERLEEGGVTGDAERTSDGFANQVKRLKDTLFEVSVELGSKLLPIMTRWVSAAGDAALAALAWIRNNGPLLASIAKIAAGLLIAGAGVATIGGLLVAGSFGVGAFGLAIGALKAGLLLVPAAVATVGAGIAALGPLLLPLSGGLLAVATNAGGAAEAAGLLKDVWVGAVKIMSRVWGGVVDALRGGNLEAALGVVSAGVQLGWAQMVTGLQSTWLAFSGFVGNTLDRLYAKIIGGAAFAAAEIANAVGRSLVAFEDTRQGIITELVAKGAQVAGSINSNFDADGFEKILRSNQEADSQRRRNRQVDAAAQRDAFVARFREQANANADGDSSRRDARNDQRLQELQDRRLAAEQKLTDALDTAAKARVDAVGEDAPTATEGADPDSPDAPAPAGGVAELLEQLLQRARGGLEVGANLTGNARGSFDARTFQSFGAQSGTDPALLETARNTKKTNSLLQQGVDRGSLSFG